MGEVPIAPTTQAGEAVTWYVCSRAAKCATRRALKDQFSSSVTQCWAAR